MRKDYRRTQNYCKYPFFHGTQHGDIAGHEFIGDVVETDNAVTDAVAFEAKGSLTETILSNLKLESSSGKLLRQRMFTLTFPTFSSLLNRDCRKNHPDSGPERTAGNSLKKIDKFC